MTTLRKCSARFRWHTCSKANGHIEPHDDGMATWETASGAVNHWPSPDNPLSGREYCPRCGSGPRQLVDVDECPDCGRRWEGPPLLGAVCEVCGTPTTPPMVRCESHLQRGDPWTD